MFAGGGAINSGGSTSFSRSQIQGETSAFTGQIDPRIRQQRARAEAEIRLREEMMNDQKFQEEIKKGQLQLIDKFIDEAIGDPSSDIQDNLNDHLNALLLIQMLEKDIQIEDADTYYSLLDKYDIEAEFDDVQDFQTRAREQILENFLGDINDFFDGIGKIDAIEGSGVVENIGEATTDIIEAIVQGNPRYGAIAVAELLGVEFDQDGNFDLRNTIMDNTRPIIQKIIARYVINPLKDMVKGWGATTEELEEHLTPLLEEIVEEEAPVVEATIADELTALAETETLAIPGIIIGGIQASSAVLRAVGGVLQAINLTHDAYTKKNHTWADQNSGFVGFVKKIPLINELAESIADIIAEAKDMRAYRKGETDRQNFEKEYNKRLEQRREQETVLRLLANGTITFDDIENGRKYKGETKFLGIKVPYTIDLSKYQLDKLKNRLEGDIDALKVDGENELNNLISFYNDETEKMLNAVPSSLKKTFQFNSRGEIVNWDNTRVRDWKKTVKSKNLGDILFAGGKREVPITQEEFLNYVRNYNDYIMATKRAREQIQQLERLS